MARGDKAEEALLRSIRRSNNVSSKSQAVAIAKSRGLLRQSGKNLVLTEKGRNAAGEAQRNGE